MSPINKIALTEADIISKYLLPAIKAAGWDDLTQIRQEVKLRDGKVVVRGQMKAYLELREHAAGGAQPNLNVGKIASTVIPLPPIDEQHRIVAKVDELMALCDQLKSRLQIRQQTQLALAGSLTEGALT